MWRIAAQAAESRVAIPRQAMPMACSRPMSHAPVRLAHSRMLFRLLSMGAFLLVLGCASPPGRLPGGGAALLTADQSNDVAVHALGLVGTPYRYGGNTPEGGFDCSGLIGYVYRSSLGKTPPRPVARMASFGQPVAMSEIRSGYLVLFGNATPSHAGISLGDGRFVH